MHIATSGAKVTLHRGMQPNAIKDLFSRSENRKHLAISFEMKFSYEIHLSLSFFSAFRIETKQFNEMKIMKYEEKHFQAPVYHREKKKYYVQQ